MQVLHRIIESSWSEETANLENQNIGQSDITALVIKTILGGKIIRLKTNTKDHYCNVINSTLVDYTNESFADYHLTETSISEVDESELLEKEELRQRYLIFLKNITHTIQEEFKAKLAEDSERVGLTGTNNSPYIYLDLTDYYDGGAYEMVAFTLKTASKSVHHEYIKDKEDGTISMTSRTKKTSQKDQKLNPTIIDQVLSLARENKSSIESIKILEKKVSSLVTD